MCLMPLGDIRYISHNPLNFATFFHWLLNLFENKYELGVTFTSLFNGMLLWGASLGFMGSVENFLSNLKLTGGSKSATHEPTCTQVLRLLRCCPQRPSSESQNHVLHGVRKILFFISNAKILQSMWSIFWKLFHHTILIFKSKILQLNQIKET